MLRREVWVDRQDRVVWYNLAYVNHFICAADNGRVVGYDSAHGTHHRHYQGKVTVVSFQGFKQIEARFEKDWRRLVKEAQHAKD